MNRAAHEVLRALAGRFVDDQGGGYPDRPTRLAVTMPRAEFTRAVDFNTDGRRDILIHYRSRTEPDRVTVLVAE